MSHIYRQLKTQATQLFELGKITTTQAKAQKLKQFVESLLAKSRQNDLNAKRLVKSLLTTQLAIKKVSDLPNRVSVKFYRVGNRAGDNAPLAQLVLDIPKPAAEQVVNNKITKGKSNDREN